MRWKHFSRYWPFVRGIHRSPVNSPHKGQWSGALVFSLIWLWINGWVNNRVAGDLRRYRTHYDVTVMHVPSQHGNAFRIIDPLWGESSCIPFTNASHVDLWCVLVIDLIKLLSKQSRCWWFESPWRSCDVTLMVDKIIAYIFYSVALQHVALESPGYTNTAVKSIPCNIRPNDGCV